MHAFKDRNDRTWELAIHVAGVKRVRAVLGVNLYQIAADGFKAFGELFADPAKFVDVLYLLCKEQADKAGVDDWAFGSGMGGDALEEAARAFVDELLDFFPNPKARESLRKVVEKSRQVTQRTMERLTQRAEKTVGLVDVEAQAEQLEQVMMERAEQAISPRSSNGSSGTVPESSGSIPGPSRSAS